MECQRADFSRALSIAAARTETDLDGVYPALEEAYGEVARQAPAYREWQERERPAPGGPLRPRARPSPEPLPLPLPLNHGCRTAAP
ncbi:hypothetical protein [Streptomyces cahuitamycinicus]|uniref:hypothetical protein n=1 Tax=Streptomyces cahuitamycinicus TaxID=2070367 RepID=UPI0026910ABD